MILMKSICARNSKSIARHGPHVIQEIYLDKLSMHLIFSFASFNSFWLPCFFIFQIAIEFPKDLFNSLLFTRMVSMRTVHLCISPGIRLKDIRIAPTRL